ncbi:MAG TPA: hypothetical protein ENN39_10070 [Desulfonatronum sp.]|nr:hypothetical protein [Desulfonatronum sp.]
MQRIFPFLACFALLSVIGCGYHFTASAPIQIPRGITHLYIRDVNNPTVESWIDPYLRSRFEDEFTRRAKIAWVSPEDAEAYVDLTIISYSVDTDLAGARDITLTEQATVILEVELRSQLDGSRIWSSGHVRASETFESGTSEIVAGERAVEDAIRRIADSLGADY